MRLAERAIARDGVTPIPMGYMIETRSARYGSLFLKCYREFNGTTYIITRGVKGHAMLRHFVVALGPRRRLPTEWPEVPMPYDKNDLLLMDTGHGLKPPRRKINPYFVAALIFGGTFIFGCWLLVEWLKGWSF